VALARLAEVKAIATDKGVLLQWRTGFEIDNLGFNIYRERDGHRKRLNPGIIAGSALIVGQGTALDAGYSYSWFDSEGTAECQYYLEDMDLAGKSTLHPAITPEWKSNVPAYSQSRLLSELGSANSAATTQREWAGVADDKSATAAAGAVTQAALSDQWEIANTPALKIGVRSNGWYRIIQSEMSAAGFDTSADAGNLRMFVNASEIAISVSRDTGPLLSSDYIEFWGEGVDLPSTDMQIYWLVNGAQPGKRVARVAELKIDNVMPAPTDTHPGQGSSADPTFGWLNGIITGTSGVEGNFTVTAPRQKKHESMQLTETAAPFNERPESASTDNDGDTEKFPVHPLQLKPAPRVPIPSSSTPGIRTIARAPRTSSSNAAAGRLRNRGRAKSPRKQHSRNHRRKSRVRRNHATALALAVAPSFVYTIERKARTVYATSILNGDTENFFGEVVTPTLPSFTIRTPSPDSTAAVSAQIQITLQGFTQQDHQVKVLINGTQIDTMQFSFQAVATKTIFFPTSLLVDGNNSIQLTASAPGNDISLLASIRLTYPRSFKADNNTLQFTAKSTQSARIDGFTSPNIRAFDITDTSSVQEIKPIVETSGAGYAATVPGGSKGKARRLIALPASAHPVSITLNLPSTLNQSNNAADLLIISYKDFIPSLTTPVAPAGVSFINQRTAQGFTVKIVDVEDIYDEFSYGVHTSQAIKDFLLLARTNWATSARYLLLVGDASYDPRNYISSGFVDFVPSRHVDTLFMEADSDDSLADFDNDGVPEIAVGRLPARTLPEANLMISKIVNFSPANVPQSALMVADWPNGYVFTNFSEQLVTLLPPAMQSNVQRVYRPPCDSMVSSFCEPSDVAAHSDIINKINTGVALVTYSGHGNEDIWAGPIFSSTDALALNNGNKLPFVVVMDCLNGFFSEPFPELVLQGLAESLMKAPNGGAVASFASSGLTVADPQHQMGQQMFQLLYRGPSIPIGDASRQSKTATNDLDVRRTWILFGDPTMKIR